MTITESLLKPLQRRRGRIDLTILPGATIAGPVPRSTDPHPGETLERVICPAYVRRARKRLVEGVDVPAR